MRSHLVTADKGLQEISAVPIAFPIWIAEKIVSVAPPAEPRGEKKLFLLQILGGEKLLKFGEKWAVKNF